MIWKFPTYEVNSNINWPLIESKFAWFREMKGIPQDPIWHAEGNVQTHTKMVVEALVSLPEFQDLCEQDKHILLASAMFHDIEKRSTTTKEEIDGVEKIVSPKHAKRGEFTTRSLLYKDIPTPFAIREQIARLVRLHGLPLWTIEKQDPRKWVIEASLVVNTRHLSMLAKADVLGRSTHEQEDILLRIELFNELCKENNCFGEKKNFKTDYGRFLFLNKPDISPEYVPFDDLKFNVYVMCALPGSGKDYYIQRNLNLPVLSLDNIRREHKIDPTNKKKNGQVIQLAKEKAKEFMRARKSFVFNATNITRDMRSKWISLFSEYGARIKIIYIEVPYKKLITQNHNRSYKVPQDVIDKLINKLEIPTYKEAHEIEFIVEE
ncbi:poly(A) polymerase [Marinilabiliaceae bacterium JC017]|nr:poly(A) polymerase [Marinilabiliaceae bacterium JC017]